MTNKPPHYNDLYEALLLEYASGTLNEIKSVLVASHLTFHPRARQIVARYEAVAGGMLNNECDPVDMSLSALENTLKRLNDPKDIQKRMTCAPIDDSMPHHDLNIPHDLCDYVALKCPRPRWRNLSGRAAQYTKITSASNKEESLKILRISEGIELPAHTHQSSCMILVLEGQLRYQDYYFERGEFIYIEAEHSHIIQSGKDQNCTCAMVSNKPVRFENKTRQLLNLLFKF